MHFTEQTDQPRPTVFRNVGQVIIMEGMLFFRNMRKGEGEAAGHHCGNSSFTSMLLCLVDFLCLFLSFSLCLFVLVFFSPLHLREQL